MNDIIPLIILNGFELRLRSGLPGYMDVKISYYSPGISAKKSLHYQEQVDVMGANREQDIQRSLERCYSKLKTHLHMVGA